MMTTQRTVSPVSKLISFISHGLIACTLPGINILTLVACEELYHNHFLGTFTVWSRACKIVK